jgi:glycosyltransferase 2 family protein
VTDDLPIDLGALGARFAAVDARLVALAVALQLANLVLRARAWQNTLRAAHPDARVPLVGIACAYTAGMALNGILPARGGDAAKAVLARFAIAGSAVATIAGTLAVIGIFDGVAGGVALLAGVLTGHAGGGLRVPASAPLVAAAVAAVALALVLAARHFGARLRGLRASIARGGAILRTPRRYARSVAFLQALAWTARLGVVLALLHAFGIHAGLAAAVLVLVVGGVASAVPVPGGGGAQQVAAVYLLAGQATTAQALSFSLGMQAGITLLNLALGCVAAMALFRTVRPGALRAGAASLVAAREPA